MKIMFLLRFFPIYGGGEDVTLRLSEGFLQQGYEVYIGYLWDKGWEKIELNNRIKCIKLSDEECVNGEGIKKSSYREISNKLEDVIENEHISCIINQWLPPKMVFKANKGRVKIVTCRHAAIYINSFKWNAMRKLCGGLFDILLRYYYRDNLIYSDKWILLSKVFQEQVSKIYNGKYDEKIGYINNPCKYDAVKKIDIEKKEKQILFVGRLYDAKRVDMLIDIWQKVLECNIAQGWKFIIVGDGVDRNKLENYVCDKSITNVKFEGYCDPREYYEKSSIYVTASETEGYPMSIIEAMAFGCVPVVMNTYESLAEIINDQIGFAINDDSVKDFVEAIIILMSDNVKRQHMAEQCINKADNYNLKYIVEQWQREFNKMEID